MNRFINSHGVKNVLAISMSFENENRFLRSLKQAIRYMTIFALFEILLVVVLFYLVSSSLIDVDQFLWGIIVVQGCVFVFIIVSIFGSVFKKRLNSKKLALTNHSKT